MTQLIPRSADFDIQLQLMEDIYDRSDGGVDVAHRHDYYTLLFVQRAEGYHTIDYEQFMFGERQVHFVSPGQVHQVALSDRPRGLVLTFSRDFLIRYGIPQRFISDINLFQEIGHCPPLSLDEDSYQRLCRIVSDMQECQAHQLQYGQRAMAALLQLFLIYCNNSLGMNVAQTDSEHKGVCILRDFKDLVEQRYADWHMVKQYASEIHITPKHLSQTVKDLTGRVAKAHIQDRIILEAKRLLLHTDLSIKEIALLVGFEEPLHFSSFFKKGVGVSPSQFRA